MSKSSAFPDHRGEMFGRERDIDYLLERVKKPGFTVIHSRPRMGKTWLLEEVARRLTTEQKAKVGYHESTGEPDLLLRSVVDLYSRWLADAGMLTQAKTFLKKNKGKFSTKIGKAVAGILKGIKGPIPGIGAIVGIVEKSLMGLVKAQHELLAGEYGLKPLSYDQAKELVALIHEIDGAEQPVVLIMDAWEKSRSFSSERDTLSTFLSHLEEWRLCHILAAIRHPDFDYSGEERRAYEAANDLTKERVAAETFHLKEIDVEGDRAKLLAFIRENVAFADQISDEVLLKKIGYPGVTEHWKDATRAGDVKDENDLKSLAEDAQQLRYSELSYRFEGLDDEELAVAIRLVICPRINEKGWMALKPALLGDTPESIIHCLNKKFVIKDVGFPSYGHDTRHSAALKCLLSKKQFHSTIRHETEELMFRLAREVKETSEENLVFVFSIWGIGSSLPNNMLSEESNTLMLASATFFPSFIKIEIDPEQLKQAFLRAIKNDRSLHYIMEMALHNLASSHYKSGDWERANEYFSAILAQPNTSTGQKAMALFNRGVVKDLMGDAEGSLKDYSTLRTLQDAPNSLISQSLVYSAAAIFRKKDFEGALKDYSTVLDSAIATPKSLINAIIGRGHVLIEQSSTKDGFKDLRKAQQLCEEFGFEDLGIQIQKDIENLFKD